MVYTFEQTLPLQRLNLLNIGLYTGIITNVIINVISVQRPITIAISWQLQLNIYYSLYIKIPEEQVLFYWCGSGYVFIIFIIVGVEILACVYGLRNTGNGLYESGVRVLLVG